MHVWIMDCYGFADLGTDYRDYERRGWRWICFDGVVLGGCDSLWRLVERLSAEGLLITIVGFFDLVVFVLGWKRGLEFLGES